MRRLLALTSLVAAVACGNSREQVEPVAVPTAHAEEVDGNRPFTRPAADAFEAHEIARTFAGQNAAARQAAESPSF